MKRFLTAFGLIVGGLASGLACGSDGDAGAVAGDAGDAAADASEAAADAPAPLPPDPTCGDDGRTPGAGACDPHAPYDYETCNAIGDSVCNVAWACVSNDLCASADFLESGGSGSSGGGGPLHYLANGPGAETNARCVITALRDNTRGRVRFSIAQPQGGFSQTLEILGGSDRRVYGIDSASNDSPTTNHKFAAVDLRSAAAFDACLATNDVDAYARCLLDALVLCM